MTIFPAVKMEVMSCCAIVQKAVNPNQESFLAKMAMDACGRNTSVMVFFIVMTKVMSLPVSVTTALANHGFGFAKMAFTV